MAPRPATAAKVARHPKFWPISVPIGTPVTMAAAFRSKHL
ncbi:hypothetical protein QO004_003456 [Rhizobium mesoamericanum]|nr:hypothetical protein [Rhizobium mesoamericanum]